MLMRENTKIFHFSGLTNISLNKFQSLVNTLKSNAASFALECTAYVFLSFTDCEICLSLSKSVETVLPRAWKLEVIALNHHVEFLRNFYFQWYPNARFPSTVIELSVILHVTHHRGPSAACRHGTGFLCAHIRGSGRWEGFHRPHWLVVSRPDLSFWAWPEPVLVLKTTETLWKYDFKYFSFLPSFPLFKYSVHNLCL